MKGCRTINNRAIYAALAVAFVIFSTHVYTAGTEAVHAMPITAEADRGKQVFQEYNCIACHQFYGLGGYMGPDLTNVISNRGTAYARAFMASGTQAMPNFHLSDEELDALVAYLEFVDKTGTYPPKNFEVTWYGVVTQEDDPR